MIANSDEIETDHYSETTNTPSIYQNYRIYAKKLQLQKLLLKQNRFRIYNMNYVMQTFRLEFWFSDIFKFVNELGYSLNTFLLALSVFDFISAQFLINDNRLRTFCILILDIASKIHEPKNRYCNLIKEKANFEFLNELSKFADIEIVKMQKLILEYLEYHVLIPTALDFVFVIFGAYRDLIVDTSNNLASEEEMTLVGDLIISISSIYETNKFTPFVIACGSIFCVRKMLNYEVFWPAELNAFTELQKFEILDIVDFIFQIKNSQNQNSNLVLQNVSNS